MADYRKMYHILFNALTDAVGILSQAQEEAERVCLEEKSMLVKLVPEERGPETYSESTYEEAKIPPKPHQPH